MNPTRSVLFSLSVVTVIFIAIRADADFTFGEPVNLESVMPVFDAAHDSVDCFSSDGLEMYIESNRPGGFGGIDIWVSRRATAESDWGPLENLGPAVNGSSHEALASVSNDGLTLYFDSDRPGGNGSWDIWTTTRPTRNDPWGPVVNLGPMVNSPSGDGDAWISQDGRELYFVSYRAGGHGQGDIWVAIRGTDKDPWQEVVNLGPTVNSPYDEHYLSLSPDGLLLLFADADSLSDTPRPGGYGQGDMWMARRGSLSDHWRTPVNLGSPCNGPAMDLGPRISPDGSALYFCSNRTGSRGRYQAPIIPIVDFNGDKKVDLTDLVMLIQYWGSNQTLYDIGPMPWGDGKVDIEDLKVFMTYYEKENPPRTQDDQ